MSALDATTLRIISAHHPLGASTGWLAARDRAAAVSNGRFARPESDGTELPAGATARTQFTVSDLRPTLGTASALGDASAPDWSRLAAEARATGEFACELAALSEPELPSLVAWLEDRPAMPFHYLSLHAPSKHRTLGERALVALLARAAGRVDAIVLHPDVIDDHAAWAPLGETLVLENMDPRKRDGRTADELERHFALLPHAGLCFDVAHARAIDPTLAEGHAILDRFGRRLRHLHVSALDAAHHHVPLTADDERALEPLLVRCRDVPWILEAPLA